MQPKRERSTTTTLRGVAVAATLLVGAALVAWAGEPAPAQPIDFVDPAAFAAQHAGILDLGLAAQPGDGLCDQCHY